VEVEVEGFVVVLQNESRVGWAPPQEVAGQEGLNQGAGQHLG